MNGVGKGALLVEASLAGACKQRERGFVVGWYVYYGCLTLDSGFEVGFCDGDIEVAAAEIGGDGDGDVEVTDCLGPLVG